MKKYFLGGQELHLGDKISKDIITKDSEGAIHSYSIEGTFSPDFADILLETGIITVKDDNEEDLTFDNVEDAVEYLLDQVENITNFNEVIEDRLEEIDDAVIELKKLITTLVEKAEKNSKKAEKK